MKRTNIVVLAFGLLLVGGLAYSSVSLQPVFAQPPDICFGSHSAACPNMACSNNPAALSANCCWTDYPADKIVCQTCEVNTDTGEFENCSAVESKGGSGSGVVTSPPSGKAPPPSTEKCPNNSAVDQNGNCTPTTQLPGDTSDNNKPNLRGNILNDLISTQSQDSSDSGEEQENQSNG
jgi:hypothetical protein